MGLFEWLARAGVTLHPGGWATTERLLAHLNPKSGDWIIDLGCGSGRTLAKVVRDWHVYAVGVDLMPSLAAQARKRLMAEGSGHGTTLSADIHCLPFQAASFDVAFAESVFVFLPKPHAFLEVARILRPKGRFGMIELTWREAPYPRYCHQMRSFLGIPFYEILTLEGWQRALREGGFTVTVAEKFPRHHLPSPWPQWWEDFRDTMNLFLGLVKMIPKERWGRRWRDLIGLFRFTVPGIFVAMKA